MCERETCRIEREHCSPGGGGKERLARELSRAQMLEKAVARALQVHKPTGRAAGKAWLAAKRLKIPCRGVLPTNQLRRSKRLPSTGVPAEVDAASAWIIVPEEVEAAAAGVPKVVEAASAWGSGQRLS